MATKSKATGSTAVVKFPESKAPVRKFFTSSHETALLPNLIEVQLISYKWFVEKGLKDLLGEINRIELDRSNREKKYQQKYQELMSEKYYWEDKFYKIFYSEE